MKKLSVLILIALMSCATGSGLKLKGTHQDGPYQLTSTKNQEAVWESIIDFFTTNGIAIKTFDKASGFIVSEPNSFISKSTTEAKDGSPQDKGAYIVTGYLKNGLGMHFPPDRVEGSWNIRIKGSPNGGTLVSVNLVNIKATYTAQPSQYSSGGTFNLPAKSTGVFEKIIADQIK